MQLKENQVFNKFTLLHTIPILDKNRAWYRVRCECGKEELRRLDHLLKGRTKSCKKCASKQTAKLYPPPSKLQNIGDLGKTFFSSIKEGARRRNIEFNISQQDIWDLLVRQNFKCALTGVPINLSTKIYKNNPDYSKFNASLDRIDSAKGYTIDNVQWVDRDINWLKNNHTQDRFIELCKRVSEYANQQPSTSGMV